MNFSSGHAVYCQPAGHSACSAGLVKPNQNPSFMSLGKQDVPLQTVSQTEVAEITRHKNSPFWLEESTTHLTPANFYFQGYNFLCMLEQVVHFFKEQPARDKQ